MTKTKVIQGLFIVMMVIAFFTMETNYFGAYLIWMGLTAIVGLVAYSPKEYEDESEEVREYLTTDGLCGGPWDNATDLENCRNFLLKAKGEPETYVQAINLNEAIGIYLVNNPEVSFDDISEIRTTA